MKKYSLTRKENWRHTNRKRLFGSVAFILAMVFLLATIAPRFLSLVSDTIVYPFEQSRIWLAQSSNALPVFIRDRNELLQDMRQLESRLATTQGTDLTVRKLQLENQELRELLGATPEDRTVARVIARPNQLPYDLIMLDRGSAHGVVVGAPVFIGRDHVLGVVTRVHSHTSYVTLISSPGVELTVYIVGPNIFTLTEGMGGGVIRVRVPQGIAIAPDNLVLLPALDSGVVGIIREVVTAPTKPERHGYVVFTAPLQSMQYVSIGTEPVTTPDIAEAISALSVQLLETLNVALPDELLVTPDVVPIATSTTNGQPDEE